MPKRRRSFSGEFKAKVVLEMISGDKGLMEASREYRIKATLLSRWKQEFLANAAQLFEPPQEAQDRDRRVAELERMIGRLTMQLELSKKVLSYASSQSQDKE